MIDYNDNHDKWLKSAEVYIHLEASFCDKNKLIVYFSSMNRQFSNNISVFYY